MFTLRLDGQHHIWCQFVANGIISGTKFHRCIDILQLYNHLIEFTYSAA